jgi:hypothetical protein
MRDLPAGLEERVMGDSYVPTNEDVPMHYGARVLHNNRSAVPALATAGEGTVSLTAGDEAIQQVLRDHHLVDPTILDNPDRKPFVWPAEISSSRLDSYDTRMDPETTLQNYAEDSVLGVAFCDSHEHNEQPFGRSFAGLYVPGEAVADADTAEPARTFAAFYTFPGLQVNRVNTTHLIDSIRMGIARDVSVGFKPDVGFIYRCSICGENLWSWDCYHIPGETEKVVVDEASGRTEERYVYAWVVNARLSEVSSVYDGATPWAMIVKAVREARAGRIADRTAMMVQALTRYHLPKKRAQLPGHGDKKNRRPEMADENEERVNKRAVENAKAFDKFLRTLLTKSRVDFDDDAEGEELIRAARGHIEALQERATRGDAAFDTIVKMALAQGVRAADDLAKFDEKRWEGRLRKMDPAEVVEMGAGWKEEADKALRAGRQTRDAEDEEFDDDDEPTQRTEQSGDAARTRKPAKDHSLPPADLFINV